MIIDKTIKLKQNISNRHERQHTTHHQHYLNKLNNTQTKKPTHEFNEK